MTNIKRDGIYLRKLNNETWLGGQDIITLSWDCFTRSAWSTKPYKEPNLKLVITSDNKPKTFKDLPNGHMFEIADAHGYSAYAGQIGIKLGGCVSHTGGRDVCWYPLRTDLNNHTNLAFPEDCMPVEDLGMFKCELVV